MSGIEMPGLGQVPPGSHRSMLQALHELYADAGFPSSRQISDSIAARDGFPDTVSHDVVASLLGGRSFPKWSKAQCVTMYLAEVSVKKPDVNAAVLHVHTLWQLARAENRHDQVLAKHHDENVGTRLEKAEPDPTNARELQRNMWERWRKQRARGMDETPSMYPIMEYVHELPTIPVPPAGTAMLVVRYGPKVGAWFPLLSDKRVVIGRMDDCDIVLDNSMVSRRHAEIDSRDGAFFASDLGSLNGTWINGDQLDSDQILMPGDELQIGSYRFAFLAPIPEADRPKRDA